MAQDHDTVPLAEETVAPAGTVRAYITRLNLIFLRALSSTIYVLVEAQEHQVEGVTRRQASEVREVLAVTAERARFSIRDLP